MRFDLSPFIGFTAVFLIALLLPGCGDSKHQASVPDAELLNPPSAPSTLATPTQPTSLPRYYHARSQVELDRIYGSGAPVVPGSVSTGRYTYPPSAGLNDPIVGDAAWNVSISREWRHIVIHHSATPNGSASSFNQAHILRGWDGLGYHFVIGNGTGSGDGQVEVGYRWTKQLQGAHAGNAEYNQAGIGICLVGDFEHGGYPTANQMARLRQLVRFLEVKTGIPTSEVVGHRNVPNKSTDCPGRNFDLNAFRASLGGNPMPVPVQIVRRNGDSSSSRGVRQLARAPVKGGSSLP